MSGKNLSSLFAEVGIVIPKIQRDYAEGRETESVKRKRENLLGDMLSVIYEPQTSLSLDFVYGTRRDDYFMPLDGQQRLTTLFLLHWLFGRSEILKDEHGHSKFIYETRKTSEEFCHWLVKQDSTGIVNEWWGKLDNAKKVNKDNKEKWTKHVGENGKVDKIANRLAFPLLHEPTLFDYFTELDDFRWEWHVDPNIHSMIVVLESACMLIESLGKNLQSGIVNKDNLDKITFEILDDLVCDGDVLFEKMNARGKALSTFDLLKSSLEGELERQGLELANDWRRNIDNNWIDYCWQNSNLSVSPTLDDVKKVEQKLEKLLIRFVGKSLFTEDIKGKDNTTLQKPAQRLQSCILADCDSVVDNYFKYIQHSRLSTLESITDLPLGKIYADINNMLYKDSCGWHDITQYLRSNGLKMHAGKEDTLLDDFTCSSLNHDTRVMFYAMLAYLKQVNAEELVVSSEEFSNFKDWMRFVRNVFLAANKNVRIDKPYLVKNAINAVDNWLGKFFEKYPVRPKGKEMLEFIKADVVNAPHSQEEARLKEEATKADLKLISKAWWDAIEHAEENRYLWGQIIAPLSWSYDKMTGRYDLDKFRVYVDKLEKLFASDNVDFRLLRACVSSADYRLNGNAAEWGQSTWGSLGLLNDDRDISWKRHLREEINGTYGILIKGLLDNWDADTISCDDYLESVVASNLMAIQPDSDWRYFICNLSSEQLKSLFKDLGTTGRYMKKNQDFVFVYKAKQDRADAIRYELLTAYLYKKLENVTDKRIQTVTGEGGAHFEFKYNNDLMRISFKSDKYEFAVNGNLVASGDISVMRTQLIKLGLIKTL